MSRQVKNLLFGFICSAMGFAASFYWYYSTVPDKKVVNKTPPIAIVENAEEESRRRPVSRLFWQDLIKGDSLFSGEVIETGAQSELVIQFLDTEQRLEIEANSLIVIQGTHQEANLDLLEGGIYVNNSNANSKSHLVLNTAQGKVDLSQVTASVSGSSNGKLNIQVLRGEAIVRGQEGQIKNLSKGKVAEIGGRGIIDKSSEFSLFSPALERTYYVAIGQPEPLNFKWESNTIQSNFKLLIGAQRKNLREFPINEVLGPKEFRAELPPGKFYFKIVSSDPSNVSESPLYRIDIQGIYPPTLVYPESNSQIDVQNIQQQGLTFKWTGAEEFAGIIFELSNQPSMNPLLYKKEYTQVSEQGLRNLAVGNYYVRLTGRNMNNGKLVSSKIIAFTVNNQPKITSKDPLIISWTSPQDNKIFYPNLKPEALLSWSAANAEEVTQWQVRIASEGTDINLAPAQTSKIMQLQTQMDRPGRYIAMVEALNEKNQVIGKSLVKQMELEPLPILRSPQLLPYTGTLSGSESGSVDLSWEKIPEATQYEITLKDAYGSVIQNYRTSSTSYRLSNLNPGNYQIDVQSMDSFKRNGTKNKARTLIMPQPAMLMAPKIKKIQVN